MTYSQTSACSVRPSRFYEDLESASEGFFHKSCMVEKRINEKIKNEKKNGRNVYNVVRQLLGCCIGDRKNKGSSNFTIMGYDINDVFDDVSTTVSSRNDSDTTVSYRKNEHVWVIEPSRRYKYLKIDVGEAKWMILTFASRITRGDSVNKNLLNSMINECKMKQNKITYITPNVIKNFPGLHLAENIVDMEFNDIMIGMDMLITNLENYIKIDRNVFVFIVQQQLLYAIYYTNQGTVNNIILFEIKLFNKGDISYFTRFMSFTNLFDVKEYIMGTRSVQGYSKSYFYFFNFQKLTIDYITSNVIENETNNDDNEDDKRETDPKYDVKQLIKALKSTSNS